MEQKIKLKALLDESYHEKLKSCGTDKSALGLVYQQLANEMAIVFEDHFSTSKGFKRLAGRTYRSLFGISDELEQKKITKKDLSYPNQTRAQSPGMTDPTTTPTCRPSVLVHRPSSVLKKLEKKREAPVTSHPKAKSAVKYRSRFEHTLDEEKMRLVVMQQFNEGLIRDMLLRKEIVFNEKLKADGLLDEVNEQLFGRQKQIEDLVESKVEDVRHEERENEQEEVEQQDLIVSEYLDEQQAEDESIGSMFDHHDDEDILMECRR